MAINLYQVQGRQHLDSYLVSPDSFHEDPLERVLFPFLFRMDGIWFLTSWRIQ